jgi:hypothetical protein
MEELALLKDCEKHEEKMTKLERDKWDNEREKLFFAGETRLY